MAIEGCSGRWDRGGRGEGLRRVGGTLECEWVSWSRKDQSSEQMSEDEAWCDNWGGGGAGNRATCWRGWICFII